MDDAPSHTINQEDPDEASLRMQVCALRHHSQQIWIEVLRAIRRNTIQHLDQGQEIFIFQNNCDFERISSGLLKIYTIWPIADFTWEI